MKFIDILQEDDDARKIFEDNARKKLAIVYKALKKGISQQERNITNRHPVHYILPDDYKFKLFDTRPINEINYSDLKNKIPVAVVNRSDIQFFCTNGTDTLQRMNPGGYEFLNNFYEIRSKFQKFNTDLHLVN